MVDRIDLIPIILCVIAAAWDLRTREIPDTVPVLLLVLLPVKLALIGFSDWPWHVLGGVVGFLVAAVIAGRDRFGGGDVKLFAGTAAWFGLGAVIPLAVWIGIAGLPLCILAMLRKQADLAYGPAILMGVCVHAIAPRLLQQIAGIES